MCNADMAVAAEVLEEDDATDSGRAFERPAIGSAFEAGHGLLTGFFLLPQPAESALPDGCTPLLCTEEAEAVELDDEDEAMDDDELERCTLFLGMNILETSSALIEFKLFGAPLPVLHPDREIAWKLGGAATAVI